MLKCGSLLEVCAQHARQIWRSKFARKVLVVAAGTGGAQAIAVVFSPIITRLYGPDAFGVLGAFMAILAAISPVTALCYPIAIVLPKHDQDALGIARLSAYISLVVSLVVAVGFWVGGDWIVTLFRIEELGKYILLIPLGMLFSTFLEVAQQWLVRKEAFVFTARVAIIQSFLLNIAQVVVGLFAPIAVALILISTVSRIVHAVMLGLRVNCAQNDNERLQVAYLFLLAKKYYDFPLYRAPQVFVNAVSQSMPLLALASFFGPTSAGYYLLARMVLGVPSMLVGKSVGDVFYPKVSIASRNGEKITHLIFRTTIWLAVIGLLPFGIIIVYGPWVFGSIFGDDWIVGGEYARWLAIFFFFGFVNKPCVTAVPVLGIQKGLLVYELFSTGVKVAGLMIGFYLFTNEIVAVALFSMLGALAYVFMIVWILYVSDHRERKDA